MVPHREDLSQRGQPEKLRCQPEGLRARESRQRVRRPTRGSEKPTGWSSGRFERPARGAGRQPDGLRASYIVWEASQMVWRI